MSEDLRKRHTSGKLAAEIIAEFPDAPSRQLARMLCKRHPAVYRSVESARTLVQYYRGRLGQAHRAHVPAEKHRPVEVGEMLRSNRGYLPLPEPSEWREETLPPGPRKWLIISDIHIPYHDQTAANLAINYGRDHGCDGVLLNGDIIDCYQLSSWARDPRQRSFAGEIELLREMVTALQEDFGTVVWKLGNHEMRHERYLMAKAPELFGMPQFSYDAYLGLPGVRIIQPMHPIRQGKLSILHGHEWGSGIATPVNPARTAYLKASGCVIVGHLHRTSEHSEVTIDGTTITCWSVGCLCDLHPLYRPVANRWNHGFAMLSIDGDTWRVENKRIVKGEVV